MGGKQPNSQVSGAQFTCCGVGRKPFMKGTLISSESIPCQATSEISVLGAQGRNQQARAETLWL